MFMVSFFSLSSSELSFKFMDDHINATISIITPFSTNENFAVFGPCNYLYTDVITLAAVYKYFNLIDTVVVFGKLGSFFLCVPSYCLCYFDMFATDCKKQNYSP